MKQRILLIEDSPTQARHIGLVLESAGYEVEVAPTGRQGLERAEAAKQDLILLDVVLPDIDGYTVCRRLRQKSLLYVPILMLTEQRTSVEDKVDGLSVGADDYLSKPFDERELLARVVAMLRIKQVIDGLFSRLEEDHESYLMLKRLALTDQLTGLYNRHYFAEVLEREFFLAQRHQTSLACLMCDIDYFRDFNTRYGHPVGDWVLQEISHLIRENSRREDVIARYGGDELIALLPMTDMPAARAWAERLRSAIETNHWNSPAGQLRITISTGAAVYPSPDISRADLLPVCADKALYRAKEQGRNRVALYNPVEMFSSG
jgi:diguanylate cyclase (GGDEF)-like protein